MFWKIVFFLLTFYDFSPPAPYWLTVNPLLVNICWVNIDQMLIYIFFTKDRWFLIMWSLAYLENSWRKFGSKFGQKRWFLPKKWETFFSVEYSTIVEYSGCPENNFFWTKNSMKNIFTFYHLVIGPIFKKIEGHHTPPPKTPLLGGGSDMVNDDNSGYVSRR